MKAHSKLFAIFGVMAATFAGLYSLSPICYFDCDAEDSAAYLSMSMSALRANTILAAGCTVFAVVAGIVMQMKLGGSLTDTIGGDLSEGDRRTADVEPQRHDHQSFAPQEAPHQC